MAPSSYQNQGKNGAAEVAAAHGVTKSTGHRDGSPVYRIPEVCHGIENGKFDLHIWDGDGGSLGAKCWSQGCSFQSILDALGIEFTYEGRRHTTADGRAVLRRRGRSKDLTDNYGSNADLLVRLDSADKPDKTVVFVEGEKAYDAFAAYGSPNFTAAHWVGGLGSVSVADFSPLQGRAVIMLPDNDAAGKEAMVKAAVRLKAVGAASLFMADVSGLPDKADCADLSGEQIKALLDSAEEYTPPWMQRRSRRHEKTNG